LQFLNAFLQVGAPRVITLDGYAAPHRAVAKWKAAGTCTGPGAGTLLQVPEQPDREMWSSTFLD
jgi:hypothetical protein